MTGHSTVIKYPPPPVYICSMDVDMISWMEKELRQESMAVVLVTHDRWVASTRIEEGLDTYVLHRAGA